MLPINRLKTSINILWDVPENTFCHENDIHCNWTILVSCCFITKCKKHTSPNFLFIVDHSFRKIKEVDSTATFFCNYGMSTYYIAAKSYVIKLNIKKTGEENDWVFEYNIGNTLKSVMFEWLITSSQSKHVFNSSARAHTHTHTHTHTHLSLIHI